ncbi:MAG: dihydropteroate synthase, partial [Planctomycetota bacterium]
IGAVLQAATDDRLSGTLATVCCAAMSGAHIMRVHDIKPVRRALEMCEAVRLGENYEGRNQ